MMKGTRALRQVHFRELGVIEGEYEANAPGVDYGNVVYFITYACEH